MLFNELPKWANILIYVGFGILALFIIAFITTIFFVAIFTRKIKNTSNTINLLLAQRYEVMMDFIKLAEKKRVKIPAEEKIAISYLERITDFQTLSKADRDQRVLSFVHSSHNIISICEHSSKLLHDERYSDKLVEFNDIEETYRQKSAQYNADIIGYNYWVNIPFIKIFLRLFGKKSKDLIV